MQMSAPAAAAAARSMDTDEQLEFLLPAASHFRTVLEFDFNLPPFADSSTRVVQLDPAHVRANEAFFARALLQLPTSRRDKIKGSLNPQQQQQQHGAQTGGAEEIKRSLIVIGNASHNNLDAEVLLTAAPGFSSGIARVESLVDKEADIRRKQIKAERERATQEQQQQQESEDDVTLVNQDANIQQSAATSFPEKPSSSTMDSYLHPQASTVWASLDNSSVDDFHREIPNLAIQYPFELDAFQKRAVLHLERHESVFVAAHTSAGKTVVAEYAIALALEHRTRVVYTSPIKALSNQKFRDFSEKFGAEKIGLLTGDNSVNPTAPCVIMTTEILRSMLYRGAEMIRDVEFVIFDEVHYVSDPDRGYIWEEVVILLPYHVHCVMLSATTPNTLEFSAWVGRNRREHVFVVSTDKRPVPLEHSLYSDGEMFRVMDSQSPTFNVDAYQACVRSKRAKDPFADTAGAKQQAQGQRRDQFHAQQKWAHSGGGGMSSRNAKTTENKWLNLVKDLEKNKFLPAIIFTFSKKQVELRASALLKCDLLTAKEKSAAHVILKKALARLQEHDRTLPQIQRVAELLDRGIGIHHGGLLPILKEVVEICFTTGLVRVLIATETFAMGVNAPCRTVVFGGLRKHDGNVFRDLLPGEYIQMCGRAGRRGLDTVGTVLIHCEDDVPPLENLQTMLSGRASSLASRFRLRYSMILNLMKTENLTVADMMKRSFSEFSRVATVGFKATRIKDLRKELLIARRDVVRFGCVKADQGAQVSDIEDFTQSMHHVANHLSSVLGRILNGTEGRKAQEEILRKGRIIIVSIPSLKLFSLRAVVVSAESTNPVSVLALLPKQYELPAHLPALGSQPDSSSSSAAAGNNLVGKRKNNDLDDEFDLLAKQKKTNNKSLERKQPMARGKIDSAPTTNKVEPIMYGSFPDKFVHDTYNRSFLVVQAIMLQDIEYCTNQVLDRIGSGSDTSDGAARIAQLLLEKCSSIDHFPKIDPVKDFKAGTMSFVNEWNSLSETFQQAELQSPCFTCPKRDEHRVLAQKALDLKTELNKLQRETGDESLALFPDMQNRLHVLQSKRYVLEEDEEVTLKGKCASLINTCDELLLTEMIFENVFDNLDEAECAALLSCLVLQQKCDDELDPPTVNLECAYEKTLSIAHELLELQDKSGVLLGTEDWVASVFNPGLLRVVYEWAKGRAFGILMGYTSLEEGIIVRAITRLDETCREVQSIAKLIGDGKLLQKIEAASIACNRDIVFATSLYVS